MTREAFRVPQHGPDGAPGLAPWLDVVGVAGAGLAWSVHYLWALAKADEVREWHAQTPDSADDAFNQYVGWDDLRRLSDATHQVIDGTFIGRPATAPAPRFREMLCLCCARVPLHGATICLQAVDSTCWYLWTAADACHGAVRSRFPRAVRTSLPDPTSIFERG